MPLSKEEITKKKIARAGELIDIEIGEMVRLEEHLKREEIVVAELPENGAKEVALEELTKRVNRYKDQLNGCQRNIDLLELMIEDYQKSLN